MNAKNIKKQFINEYNNIMPDFDSILTKINSVEVLLQPVVDTVKDAKPQFSNVWNRHSEVEARQPKIKLVTAFMSLCACIMLVAVSMFYCGIFSLDKDIVIQLDKQADSYVTLNINPEFDFAVNKFNKITTVKSKKESSKLLLAQLYKTLAVDTLVGMELNGVLLSVIDEAAKMGYIDVESKGLSNAIMIDVMGANVLSCANTKSLLASEANGYFAEKGILAVVVTNYDSKASLVAEARKANPNVSADASIGELISTVETADGGKSMYELEIERIKKENGNYSNFLDKDEVSRVNFAASEKVYLYNDMIAKQNKIIANLELLKLDYIKQIDAKQIAIDSLQKDKDYYIGEIAKINADPESYGVADIFNQSLKAIEDKIANISTEIKESKDFLANIDAEYENKLAALQSSKVELQNAMQLKIIDKAALTQNIANINSNKTVYVNNNAALAKSINDEHAKLTVIYNDLEIARQLIITTSKDYDNFNNKYFGLRYHYQLENIIAAVDSLNSESLPELQKEYTTKFNKLPADKKYNYVDSVPEYVAIKIVEKMAKDYGAFIDGLMFSDAESIVGAIEEFINIYYKQTIYDKTIFTEEEIKHNTDENFYARGRGAVGNIIKEHLAKWSINEDINDIMVNFTKADQLIDALSIKAGHVNVNSEEFKSEILKLKNELLKHEQDYENAQASYDNILLLVSEIEEKIAVHQDEYDENKLIIDGYNQEIELIENDIEIIDSTIQDIDNRINNIAAEINDIGNAKAQMILKLNQEIYSNNNALAEFVNTKSQLIKDLAIAVENNKKLAVGYANVADNININITTIESDIAEINAKINLVNQNVTEVKTLVLGYNQIILQLKTFSAIYSHGTRIASDDKYFENQFNAEIVAIEQLILTLRTSSEKDMQDSIKSNLDKMADAKLNKNIDRYNNHSESLTQEELNNWQTEQEEYFNDQGWDNIYQAWLTSQNN